MKKVFMVLLVLAMVMSIGTVAQASLVQDNLYPVRFFVVDDDSNNIVKLEITHLNPLGNIDYSTDQINWTPIVCNPTTEVTFNIPNPDRQLVYWRLNTGTYDYTADLEFMGSDSGGLWNGVTIYWDETRSSYSEITFEVPADCDKIAPVPIPASALLLGSGMVGLIGFGKRMRKKNF
jgi:hypothetical protein